MIGNNFFCQWNYKLIFNPIERRCSFIFSWGLKNTLSSLSMRCAFLLFLPEAVNNGILPSIAPVPAIARMGPAAECLTSGGV